MLARAALAALLLALALRRPGGLLGGALAATGALLLTGPWDQRAFALTAIAVGGWLAAARPRPRAWAPRPAPRRLVVQGPRSGGRAGV